MDLIKIVERKHDKHMQRTAVRPLTNGEFISKSGFGFYDTNWSL